MHPTIKFLVRFTFVFISVSASAQYTKLLEFTGPNGLEPWGSLISDGTFLYGLTGAGGANGMGTIFKIRTDGTDYENLLDFAGTANGAYPYGSLFSDGTFLYGMTSGGGASNNGTIFKIMPDGTGFVKLLDFTGTANGRNPYGSLISDGTFLYGMTHDGGTSDMGTIFKILKDGNGYVKLFDFTGTANGSDPYGDLLLIGTTLYGLTSNGGSNGRGIIFRIGSDGTGFTRMLNFVGYPSGGDEPLGSLITDGTFLYGMTSGGGTSNDGTIFRMRNDGTGITTIKNFRLTQGDSPFASLLLIGTDLYGMTYAGGEGGTHDYGTLFKIKPDGSGHVKLFDFNTVDKGWLPNGSLITDGSFLYGLTQDGGGAGGGGVVFKYELPSSPTITSFTATSGSTGTSVTITGTNFSTTPGNNFVNFNGWPATVTASTATSITATVPPAATTGRITVTVLGNTATSASDFTVNPGGIAIHSFDWADPLVGTLDTFLDAMTTDPSGNVYTAGTFSETTDFDPGPGEFNLTSAGQFDVFVSKMNSDGEFEWAFRLGATDSDNATAIASDATGNVYVAGLFIGTDVDFDPGPGTTTLPGPLARFICKYDPDGNLVWARQLQTNLSGFVHLAITPANDVYVAGGFTGTNDFDPGAGVSEMTSAGSVDIFVLKLTSAGNFVWARRMGSTDGDVPNGLALDGAGNIVTTGFFSGTVDFDPEGGTANLATAGIGSDVFISKLNPLGGYVWARRVGGSNVVDVGHGIAVDPDNNVLVAGIFNGNGDYDPGAPVVTIASQGAADVFVLKLDAAGIFAWVKTIGGPGGDLGYRIITDADGNIYYSGDFSNTVDFDPGQGDYSLTAGPLASVNNHTYVSKLDPDGNFVWAWSTTGTLNSWAEVPIISLDQNEDIVLAGYMQYGTIEFDHSGCTAGLTTGASVNSFITKLSTTATSACEPGIVFSLQPSSTSSCSGSSTFTVVASGDTNLVYQWQIDDTGFVDLSNDATYSGVNTATLTISSPAVSLNGSVYRVLVRGDNTTDTPSSSATLTISTPPAIPVVNDPAPVCPSSTATLTASGSSDGNYRWYEGTTLITGEVNSTYLATASTSTQTYGVSIHDGTCESAIVPVVLTVTECTTTELVVYNAVSPNGDGKNDIFLIENISYLESTRENKVMIFNRWGDVVFEVDDYDNDTRVFMGLNSNGKELPTGTYYYRIEFETNDSMNGFISLQR